MERAGRIRLVFFARDLLQGTDPFLSNANLIGSRTSGFKVFEGHAANEKYDFLGPLPGATEPTTYTIYLQQSGANTEYQLDLVVEAIPEPGSLGLAASFATLLFLRRRRS